MDVEKKVKEIIAEKLKMEVDVLKDEALFIDDLGADSLDIVEIIMKIEEEFGISVPDEDLEGIRNVKDAVEYVKSKVDR